MGKTQVDWAGLAALMNNLVSLVLVVLTLINRQKIRELHVILNSRLTQLLDVTGKSERAAGRVEALEERDAKTR